MDPTELTAELKLEAQRLGFAAAGVCPAVTPTGLHTFYQWLDAGHAGEMHYLQDRRDAYSHPRHVLEGVQSLVMLAMCYQTNARSDPAHLSRLNSHHSACKSRPRNRPRSYLIRTPGRLGPD